MGGAYFHAGSLNTHAGKTVFASTSNTGGLFTTRVVLTFTKKIRPRAPVTGGGAVRAAPAAAAAVAADAAAAAGAAITASPAGDR